MNLIQTIDGWMIDRAEDVLRWLNEWLSISWRQATTAVIVAHAAFMCMWSVVVKEHVLLVMSPLMAAFLVLVSRVAEAERVRTWRSCMFGLHRMGLVYMIGVTVTSTLLPHGLQDGWMMAAGWFFMLLSLLFLACGDAGIRGRRRKAAVGKILEMFGAEWMAKPLPTPV